MLEINHSALRMPLPKSIAPAFFTRVYLPKLRGFTLIELMVVISILAILLMIAAPSFTEFRRNSELRATSSNLVAALNTARAEAMKTGNNVSVRPLVDKDWQQGWQVFTDPNRNGTVDTGEEQIVSYEALPSYIKAEKTNNSNQDYITFNGTGFSKNASGGFGADTVSFSREDTENDETANLRNTRRVKIAGTGRVRVCTPAAKNDANCFRL